MRSYGGVKGRAPQAGTAKRSSAAKNKLAAQRAAFRNQQVSAGFRTGGFVSPVTSGELKFTDVSLANGTCALAARTWTTPGPTFLLNGLVPDSTATGRIGRKVVMKSLYLRMFSNFAATTTGFGYIRYLVVYDRQSNAQAPAVTDILLSDDVLSQMNISNKDRFVILASGSMDPISAQANGISSEVEIYKKLNLPVQFNAGTAGTIGDIQTGAVYILFAQTGGLATTAPQFSFRSRIRYSDN